jgi:hypothetical protein
MNDEEIEDLIDSDIQAAIAAGHTIDMNSYGVWLNREVDQRVWEPQSPDCPVCAIGACLLGKPALHQDEWITFARMVGRSDNWGSAFAIGTTGECFQPSWYTEDEKAGLALGYRMFQKYEGGL